MAASHRRNDPAPRATRGRRAGTFDLKNQDPNKVYKWVFLAIDEMGVDYMMGLDYETEKMSKDGVQLVGKSRLKMGEEIVRQGYQLMSTSKDNAEDIRQFGPQGDTGQDEADRIMKKIITKRGGSDPLRGIGLSPRHASVENEIEAPYLDMEPG